jgi:hypothetical protein
MIVSRLGLMMRNITEKNCRENQNTHFIFNNVPPPARPRKSCRLWGNVEKCGKTGQNKVTTLWGACALHAG